MFGAEPITTLSLLSEIKNSWADDNLQKLIETELTQRETDDHNYSGDNNASIDAETSKIGDNIQEERQIPAENLHKQASYSRK